MNAERLAELRELAAKTQSAAGMECLAYIDELRAQLKAQAARGGAVVVPKLTEADLDALAGSVDATWEDDESDEIAKAAYALAVSRIQPIPAFQVLQPGMVGVDREELAALRSFYEIVRCHMMAEGGVPMSDALGSAMDTLDDARDRAQQSKGGE